MAQSKRPPFNYNPTDHVRETRPFYIGPSEKDIVAMQKATHHSSLDELYQHIPAEVRMNKEPAIGAPMGYEQLAEHLWQISQKNKKVISFLGDGLPHFSTHPIVPEVCNHRGLTTAYTPYQPERSQGTLYSLWAYSCNMSMLTGIEAINASLYDRASGIFEAISTAVRIKKKNTILIAQALYPGDWEVLETMVLETPLKLIAIPCQKQTGRVDLEKLKFLVQQHAADTAAIVFPHVNSFGLIEDVHALTRLAKQHDLLSIGVIDPLLLAAGGLTAPAQWGDQGVDMIVGEAQHMAIGPNYGGPGLGVFGIRYNDKDKNNIRSSPGRYVGKATDSHGREALLLILSTREQHIRREKATSNICSNQSFLASLVGAAMLARGEKGLAQQIAKARHNATELVKKLTTLPNVSLAFPDSPCFNELCLELGRPVDDVIKEARAQGIHIGVNLTGRNGDQRQLLLISLSDRQEEKDLDKLYACMAQLMGSGGKKAPANLAPIPSNWLRQQAPGLLDLPLAEVSDFYQRLNKMNISPDDNLYPLGSCTMKFNPYINDWAAGLEGFTECHPQAPVEDVQGCLEILYEMQEMFKAITGLPGVTTQPLAGAQGEYVGLKLFQAYFRDRHEKRDILLIPRSAHGTNPATASVAGYESKMTPQGPVGIVTIEALSTGEINVDQVAQLCQQYGNRVAGIMVTNPNTSGIFETKFKQVADVIHAVGGLVYMDGANMNAIAGNVDLGKLGVDAVHQNLHKTWTIPHGGGGPGDAVVAVSQKLIPYLPGHQVIKDASGMLRMQKMPKSIGSIHRHHGNFAHKVRAYTYIKALGGTGVKKMSAVAVLSSLYLFQRLKKSFPILPTGTESVPRMHEFILTLTPEDFSLCEKNGTPKALTMAKLGKLFLDFGPHAPTVAFPEQFGLMIEPTESYTMAELDRFCETVEAVLDLMRTNPTVLTTAPHFTPISKIDDVEANRNPILWERLLKLPSPSQSGRDPRDLMRMPVEQLKRDILKAHQESQKRV